ncbi:Protein FIZZY-RELATED 2 [Platanthera guangdongensis]|uniref:Protein FIZZY-RELATED 2 n=1 Tax=Platanthera guangdongensis TaxID=2320717 RepID=A0ABR2LP69_9ASPA
MTSLELDLETIVDSIPQPISVETIAHSLFQRPLSRSPFFSGISLALAPLLPPDLSQHSVLIREPAPPLVPDLSQPSVTNHYLPPSANVWIYLPPTATSSVPPRRRTRAHPSRLILSFSVNTAGFPVVGLGFVLQHAPPTVGFPVVGLGIVRQHALQVGALAWSSSCLSSGSRDKSIFQRDICVQEDYIESEAAENDESNDSDVECSEDNDISKITKMRFLPHDPNQCISLALAPLLPPDLSQHSVLIREPAPPLVPDLSQPSVPNHYLPPSANVWIYLPPTATSSVPPRRRTRAHPSRLILSFSVNTAGFPVVGLGFVLQHTPLTVGFPVVGLGIVRQHALQVGALAWSSSCLSSGSRDKSIFQRDICVQEDYIESEAAENDESNDSDVECSEDNDISKITKMRFLPHDPNQCISLALAPLLPPDLSQHSVLIREPAPPLVPDLSQPSVPNHYLPPSANVWIYLPPTATSSVPPRRRTRAHPSRLILSFSVNTAGFPVVGLGFVLQHAPPTVGFPVVGLGIVRQHALQVGALAWSSSCLSSGSRDKSIFQRDICVQEDYIESEAAENDESNDSDVECSEDNDISKITEMRFLPHDPNHAECVMLIKKISLASMRFSPLTRIESEAAENDESNDSDVECSEDNDISKITEMRFLPHDPNQCLVLLLPPFKMEREFWSELCQSLVDIVAIVSNELLKDFVLSGYGRSRPASFVPFFAGKEEEERPGAV